jgi:hypothetical protein
MTSAARPVYAGETRCGRSLGVRWMDLKRRPKSSMPPTRPVAAANGFANNNPTTATNLPWQATDMPEGPLSALRRPLRDYPPLDRGIIETVVTPAPDTDPEPDGDERRKVGLALQAGIPRPSRRVPDWLSPNVKSSEGKQIAGWAVNEFMLEGLWGLVMTVPAAIVWLFRRVRGS